MGLLLCCFQRFIRSAPTFCGFLKIMLAKRSVLLYYKNSSGTAAKQVRLKNENVWDSGRTSGGLTATPFMRSRERHFSLFCYRAVSYLRVKGGEPLL